MLLSHFSCVRLHRHVQPHRRQPTRLPCPWESPGKNTGVGCHFLLQCIKVKSESEVAQSCLTLCDPMHCSLPGSSVHGIFQARVLEWGATAFSNPPHRVMEIKTTVNKWDLIKLKSFYTAKKTINKVKRQPSDWEKVIANETTDKGFIPKIYKQLIQFIARKTNNPSKMWEK